MSTLRDERPRTAPRTHQCRATDQTGTQCPETVPGSLAFQGVRLCGEHYLDELDQAAS